MIKMVSRMSIMMALLLMLFSAVAENCHEYLTKPTGYFGVGYQDYHWIDEQNCPGDAQYSGFYNGHNAGEDNSGLVMAILSLSLRALACGGHLAYHFF